MQYAFNKVILDLEADVLYIDSILSKYGMKFIKDEYYGVITSPIFYKNTRKIIKEEQTFKKLFRALQNNENISNMVDTACALPWLSIELICSFCLDVIHSKIALNKGYDELLLHNPFINNLIINNLNIKYILNLKLHPTRDDLLSYIVNYTYIANPYAISTEDLNYIYIRLLNIVDFLSIYTSAYENGVFDLTFNNNNAVLEYMGSIADVRYKEYLELRNDINI